jgi:hypothetical protein
MLTQIKVWEGFDLNMFADEGVVGGDLFVDEGFVGDHFADSLYAAYIYTEQKR